MGHIMVRLMCTGSMFVGPGTKEGRERGREGWERKEGSRKGKETVPPRLSLSAGFTWMGLFICDTETKRSKGRVSDRDRAKERKKTCFPLSPPHSLKKKKKNFVRITQPNCG